MSNLDFINPTVGHKPSNDDSRASHSSGFSIPEFRAICRQLRSYLETGLEEINGDLLEADL